MKNIENNINKKDITSEDKTLIDNKIKDPIYAQKA